MDKIFYETNTDIHVTIFEFLNVFDYSKVASTNKKMFNMIANNIKIRKRLYIYNNIKPNIKNSLLKLRKQHIISNAFFKGIDKSVNDWNNSYKVVKVKTIKPYRDQFKIYFYNVSRCGWCGNRSYMHPEWQLISNKDFPYNDFIPYKVGRAI